MQSLISWSASIIMQNGWSWFIFETKAKVRLQEERHSVSVQPLPAPPSRPKTIPPIPKFSNRLKKLEIEVTNSLWTRSGLIKYPHSQINMSSLAISPFSQAPTPLLKYQPHMTITRGSARGFPPARHYPVRQWSSSQFGRIWNIAAHYRPANLGAFFNMRAGPLYRPQPMQPKGVSGLWRVGWTVIRVILLPTSVINISGGERPGLASWAMAKGWLGSWFWPTGYFSFGLSSQQLWAFSN